MFDHIHWVTIRQEQCQGVGESNGEINQNYIRDEEMYLCGENSHRFIFRP